MYRYLINIPIASDQSPVQQDRLIKLQWSGLFPFHLSSLPRIKPSYSTNSPCSLCHSSILTSPLNPSNTFFFPSGHRTQAGLLSPLTHTISSGTGKSVSIADAKGWISSGQVLSYSHSMELHFEQKDRWEVHFSARGVPRSLVAVYSLIFRLVVSLRYSSRLSFPSFPFCRKHERNRYFRYAALGGRRKGKSRPESSPRL